MAGIKKRISLLNLALPATPNIQEDENFLEFNRLYSAVKLLASAVDAMQPAQIALATEAIGFGRFVNFYDSDGELCARLADAHAGKPAHAFCLTEDLVAGDSAEFLCQGLHPGFSGLTRATRYFLASSGLVSAAPPALPKIQQALGLALSPTTMWVQCPIDYLGS